MRVEMLTQVEIDGWNSWVVQSPHGNVYQTASWGEYLRQYMHCDVYYLVCYDHGDQVAGVQVVGRWAPGHTHLLERPLGGVAIQALKRVRPVFTWNQGPVLLGDSQGWEEALALLLERVIELAGKGSIRSATLPLGVEAYLSASSLARFSQRQWATFVVDLEQDEESLWKGLKPSARKSITRARKDGIQVETVEGEAGRVAYQSFRQECLRRRGARCLSADNYLVRYRWLKSIGAEDIYLARCGPQVLCGLGIFRFNGILFEFGSHQSQQSVEQKLYGNDLLKWEIICREKQRGGRAYDLSGVNPDPRTPKEQGIFQFKKKWGGEYREYPVLSRP